MASHGFHDTDIEAISTLPSDKHFGLGVTDGKSIIAERPEWIADGVRKVLDVIPAERLALFTDCTLTGVKHIVARKKIEAIAAGARIVRAELGVSE
jgi:5-methyltetrahydropteroyltriglutamate--homocysteine methyltransferase